MRCRSLFDRRILFVAAALLGAVHLLNASAATGQACDASWTQPVVCGITVEAAAPGERFRELRLDRPISVAAGGSVELEVRGIDQRGRAFPQDRMMLGVEEDRNCRGLLTWEDEGDGRFRFTAGSQRGTCRIHLWMPGNMNLEWPLTFEVASVGARGYSREQAELLVTYLYRGVLGREPDEEGLRSQAAEVQRGRLQSVVEGMYRSPEFMTQRSRRSATELLDDLYAGLLDRPADSSGVRSYLGDMERRRYASVALRLIGSEEFEERLLAAASP